MTREEKYIHFFTNLTVDGLNQIDDIFEINAHFKDPFNDVLGTKAIKTVFSHMFATTVDPKFHVDKSASIEETLFLQWRFVFMKDETEWNIVGSSVVTFNNKDEVQEHIDYWDPAEEIYSKIGLLKPFMNFLKSRLTAK